MNRQDWERFGEDISRSVQDAVDSQDFSRLNQTITDTVNIAMDEISRGMRNVGDAVNQNVWGRRPRNRRQPYDFDGYMGEGNEGYGYRYNQNGSFGEGASGNYGTPPYYESGQKQEKSSQYNLQLYAKTTGQKVFGVLFSVFGYSMCGIFLILLLIVLISAFITGDFSMGFRISAGVCTVLFGAGIVLGAVGTNRLGLVNRFRSYLQVLENREYCDVKELCGKIGKTPQFVLKDVQKMIAKGWFKQGRLDAQKSCLMVSNSAYEQYNDLMRQMEQKRQEEADRTVKQENSELSPEVQEVIRRGDEYIARIHASNDAIPGVEISAKISRMEMLVDRIFDRVEQNPESVSDIRRLMDYYLPTTMKLLEAYEELDAQPVQGENILSSKKEIENTLDTLNFAFEKLLDDLFQDTAWDVSSDISVLNTMLAQEGLTKEDFGQK